MNPEICHTVEQRKQRNNNLFFIQPEIIAKYGEFELIKKKTFFGVQGRNGVVFDPIFDEIQFLNDSLCKIRIKERWALADCYAKKILVHFDYSDFCLVGDGMIAVISTDGLKGLYDAVKQQELIPAAYEEFGSTVGVEYVWIRKGRFYDFMEKSTGKLICVGGITKVYESRFGMFGVNNSGRVIMIGSDGYENPRMLRKVVMDAGGYLCLQNFTHKSEDYIDVYGNILNV